MSKDSNKREAENPEAKLDDLELWSVEDVPRCIVCQIRLGPYCTGLLCDACSD